MTTIICLFELVHLIYLLFDEWVDHVVKEVIVKEGLKSSIFVVQKAATPKNYETYNNERKETGFCKY